MDKEHVIFIETLDVAIHHHCKCNHREFAACLAKVRKHLPDNFAGAVAAAIEGGLDSYFIEQIKSTFSV